MTLKRSSQDPQQAKDDPLSSAPPKNYKEESAKDKEEREVNDNHDIIKEKTNIPMKETKDLLPSQKGEAEDSHPKSVSIQQRIHHDDLPLDPSLSLSVTPASQSPQLHPPSDQSILNRIQQLDKLGINDKESIPQIPQVTGVGSIIDNKYQIIKQIAIGGMGIVFAAVHIKLEKLVAIKILSPQTLHDREARERFIREAKASTLLSNPHTVRVYDYNITEWGEPYLVMEFIKGQNLRQLIKKEKIVDVERAVNITKQIAQSLMEAHSYNLIHRDLKPSNVMLMQIKGHTDFVKLFDFGIAKFASQKDDDEDLTQKGTMLGTPRYMAPEQLTSANSVTCAADIYSLALILYNMVTGEKPFSEYPSESLVFYRKEGQSPALKTDKQEIPESLKRLYDQMTQLNPKKRPTAEEIVSQLSTLEAEFRLDTVNLKNTLSPSSEKRFLYPSIIAALVMIIIVIIFQRFSATDTPLHRSSQLKGIPHSKNSRSTKPKNPKIPSAIPPKNEKKSTSLGTSHSSPSPSLFPKRLRSSSPSKKKISVLHHPKKRHKKKILTRYHSQRRSVKRRIAWIKITSQPNQVKVWQKHPKKFLGNTPLRIKKLSGRSLELHFKKAGYFGTKLVIPAKRFKRHYSVRLKSAIIELP